MGIRSAAACGAALGCAAVAARAWAPAQRLLGRLSPSRPWPAYFGLRNRRAFDAFLRLMPAYGGVRRADRRADRAAGRWRWTGLTFRLQRDPRPARAWPASATARSTRASVLRTAAVRSSSRPVRSPRRLPRAQPEAIWRSSWQRRPRRNRGCPLAAITPQVPPPPRRLLTARGDLSKQTAVLALLPAAARAPEAGAARARRCRWSVRRSSTAVLRCSSPG